MNATKVSPPLRLLVGLVCAGIVAGCAPTLLPLNIEVGKISVTKEPVSVAIVIPDSLKNHTITFDIACAEPTPFPLALRSRKESSKPPLKRLVPSAW
jgi:hypothetical protein